MKVKTTNPRINQNQTRQLFQHRQENVIYARPAPTLNTLPDAPLSIMAIHPMLLPIVHVACVA